MDSVVFWYMLFMIYDNLKEPCPDQKATSIFFPEPAVKLNYLKCVLCLRLMPRRNDPIVFLSKIVTLVSLDMISNFWISRSYCDVTETTDDLIEWEIVQLRSYVASSKITQEKATVLIISYQYQKIYYGSYVAVCSFTICR